VYEDAADVFVRARDALIDSVNDDVDIESSISDYVLAKANLEAHDFSPGHTWREILCDTLVKNEYIRPGKFEAEMREIRRGRHKGHLPMGNNHWSGRVINSRKELPIGVTHGLPIDVRADFDRYHGRADEHIFSSLFDPLEKKSMTNGNPRKIELLARRFLPDEEGNSRAKQVRDAERLIEEWMGKTGSPHVRENKKGTYSYPLLGPIGDSVDQSILSHEHDLYERDFRRWSEENAQGEDNREVREKHFSARARDWMDRDNKATLEQGMTEEERGLVEFYSNSPEAKEIMERDKSISNHPSYLNHLSFMMGLEWLSPEERTKVIDHLNEHGSDSKEQHVKFDDGTRLPMGRLKRNMRMRGTNALGHVRRGPKAGPHNVAPVWSQNLPSDPPDKRALFSALESAYLVPAQNEDDEDEVTFDRRKAEKADMAKKDKYCIEKFGRKYSDCTTEQQKQTDSEVVGHSRLMDVAMRNLHEAFGVKTDNPKDEIFMHLPDIDSRGLSRLNQDEMMDEMKTLTASKKKGNVVPRDNLLHALGFDSKGEEIPAGEHGYPEHSGPLITNSQLKSLLRKENENISMRDRQREVQDILSMFSTNVGFKDAEAIPEEIQKALEILGGKHLAHDFVAPYLEGGHAIDQHIYASKLHDHHQMDDESLIASVNRQKESITPRSINMGLFGHLIRPEAEAPLGPHYMQHMSNFLGGDTGNHALSSVTSSGIAALIHGLTQSEVNSKFGRKMGIDQMNNMFVDAANEGTRKNIPYGKSLDMLAPKEIDPEQLRVDEGGISQADLFAGGGSVRREQEPVIHTSNEQRRNKIEAMRLAMLLYSHERFPTSMSTHDFPDSSMLDYNERYGNLDEEGRVLTGRSRPKKSLFIDQLNLKHQYDMESINQAAKHLATLLPEEALDPSNPSFDANVRRLFHDAERAIHTLPSEYWEGVGVRPLTADYMVENRTQTAEPVYPSLRERLTTGGGVPITRLSDASEIAEQLGFPSDEAHTKHIQSYLDTIPDDDVHFIQSNHNLIKEHGDVMGIDSSMYDSHLDDHLKEQHGHGAGAGDAPLQAEMRNLKSMRSRMEKDIREWDLTSGKRLLEIQARLEELEPLVEKESEIRGFDALHSRAARHLEENRADRASMVLERLARKVGVDVDASNPKQALDAIGDSISEIRGDLGYGRQLHGHSEAVQGVFNRDRREQHAAFGLSRIQAPVDRDTNSTSFMRTGQKELYRKGNMSSKHNQTLHNLRDLVVYDPNSDTGADESTKFDTQRITFNAQPAMPFGVGGASMMHYFTSASNNMQFGHPVRPTHGFEFGDTPEVGTETFDQRLSSVPQHMISAALGPDVAETYVRNGMDDVYPIPEFEPSALRGGATGVPMTQDPNIGKSIEDAGLYATYLLNPDLVVKADSSPEWIPPIRPMHRIFRLRDLDELRGFTGSWVVSKWYDGDRIVLTKKKNRVKAFDEDGGQRAIPDWAKSGVKNLGDKDCTLDGILGKDTLHIIDILHYDGTDIMDMNVRERFKVLRGQYDSHEQVLISGPHDTRFTDEEGLEDAVKTLQSEHRTLLLRDGKSTYMRGERRHPKWVVLRPNRDINLIVLDRRGNGPYTYRLGAGPLLDGEGLGDRAVDHDGKVYLDAGTVSSPKPFEEGDIVRVRFSGIKRQRKGGRDIFTISPSKLVGEGEGESSVSMETLSLLAKSFPPVHLTHGIDIEDRAIVVTLPTESQVTYTLEKSSLGHWVHSPTTPLSDMGMDTYSIELSESLKPFWGEVASMMLKGKIERQKETESEVIPSEEQQEHHRRKVEGESAGIIKPGDKNILLKPKMKKALEVLERALDVLEKEQMFNTTGAKGLGIDLGGGTESPRGPTRLTSEMSLPDWDMKERPEEDPEEEYPKARELRRRKKGSQSSDSEEETNPEQE
jgi:hypothetical protein